MRRQRPVPVPTEPRPMVSRSLPRPVRWLIWFAVAAVLSVVAGFAVGLARPRVKAA